VSMCGPIMNKVKMCMAHAKKNRKLSEKLASTVNLLGEQLLPEFCAASKEDYEKINNMHNLFFLLANKTQQVFTSHVIHTIIDQNWDLKGFKMVMQRIFKHMNVTVTEGFTKTIDEHIKLQNH
jgi:proline dehydrogenase